MQGKGYSFTGVFCSSEEWQDTKAKQMFSFSKENRQWFQVSGAYLDPDSLSRMLPKNYEDFEVSANTISAYKSGPNNT